MGLVPHQKNYLMLGLYAYASNGIPGLELIGLGSMGRGLKEKIIYLGRERMLKLPLKRFVISVEGHEDKLKKEREVLKNLELAIMLTFWTITGNLNLHRPENCLATGFVGLNGKVVPPHIAPEFWQRLNQIMALSGRRLTVLGPPPSKQQYKFLHFLDVNKLLSTIS